MSSDSPLWLMARHGFSFGLAFCICLFVYNKQNLSLNYVLAKQMSQAQVKEKMFLNKLVNIKARLKKK